jgi:hypothetical protein
MSTFDAARRNSTDSGARASDRHALIEQLLLAGLDHYFVGQYEQAIHVWTRVFFLDRGHARARAYIERARCALAERQREAEARVAEDAVALRSGGGALAFTATSGFGGQVASDVAADIAVTPPRRLSRRDLWRGATEPPAVAVAERATVAAPGRTPGARLRTHVLLVTLATVLLCSAAYVVVARDRLATWWRMPVDAPTASVPLGNSEPLPLPRASEATLTRAKLLFARGHLHAAVQTLSAVGADDPLRRDADVLLADVERALLESAGLRAASPSRTGPNGAAGTAPLSER